MTSLYTGPDRGDAVNETMTLDEAWAEAEAALPEGWRITAIVGPVAGRGEWTASAYGYVPEDRAYADGPTPVAALRALAAARR